MIGALLAVPLLAGAARDSQTVPEATPDGKPLQCIPINQIRQTKVYGDKVIDFHMLGGKVYRNELPQECPQLGFEERFSYTTSLNVLCSTDIITVLQTAPMIRGPSCGLGEFQPVTLASRKAKKADK